MLPPRMQRALSAIELVAGATLVRSIAYDRWITVLAAALLLAGAVATRRGRTWGVALSFAAACAFPVAWFIGIAPMWFCFVGVIGALPFAYMLRPFARFDARATALLASAAASLGAAGAIAWKHYALAVFATFPSLTPSLYADHGPAIAALLGAAMVAKARSRGGAESAASLERGSARLRVMTGTTRMRVAEPSSTFDADAERDEAEDVARRGRARAR